MTADDERTCPGGRNVRSLVGISRSACCARSTGRFCKGSNGPPPSALPAPVLGSHDILFFSYGCSLSRLERAAVSCCRESVYRPPAMCWPNAIEYRKQSVVGGEVRLNAALSTGRFNCLERAPVCHSGSAELAVVVVPHARGGQL